MIGRDRSFSRDTVLHFFLKKLVLLGVYIGGR